MRPYARRACSHVGWVERGETHRMDCWQATAMANYRRNLLVDTYATNWAGDAGGAARRRRKVMGFVAFNLSWLAGVHGSFRRNLGCINWG